MVTLSPLSIASPTTFRGRSIKGVLTDKKVAHLKADAKPYKVSDGNGLYVLVNPNGSILWRWKYYFGGVEKLMPFGRYPDISLAEARSARDEARKLVVAGFDPMAERKARFSTSAIVDGNTFELVARNWWELWRVGKSERHAKQVMSRFEQNVFSKIGQRPIGNIEAYELVEMVRAIHKRGPNDLAARALQTCGQVFRYAIAHGLANRNPAADVRPSDVLPCHTVKNQARIEEAELPTLLRKMEAYQGTPATRLAMKLLAMTFVRTSELIDARWAEVDFDKAEWKIPAGRMKMKSAHVVPLAPQAISVLRTLQTATGHSQFLFPGDRDPSKCMSNNTILKALERMGYKGIMTGHGFRGLASTHLHEQQFPSEHIELQLAHTQRNKVKAAYDWSKHLPQRRAMMEYWAAHLDKCLTEMP